MRGIAAAVVGVVALIVGITIIFGSWYTVDETQRGVILRNGAFIGTAEPGWHGKLPWIDNVDYFAVTTKTRTYPKLETYSRDQQPADIRLSVTYRIPAGEVGEVYKRFYTEDNLVTRILDPKVYEQFKNVFGKFNAVNAVQDRARLNLEVEQAIRSAVKGPITIETVQIENIDFSSAYEASIEARMLAEVEVKKLEQNALREKVQAEIVVIQAEAAADATRAAAQAAGDAARLRGEGEAAAIEARGKALKEHPQLIELVTAEKWDGTLPTTMLPGGTVPFLNVGPQR